MRRQCVSVDFDGVLHSYHLGWHDGSVYGDMDISLVTRLHDLGYAVAVSTARPIGPAVIALRRLGLSVLQDTFMRNEFWNGGASGTVVLVTNRKIAAIAYIDDRAIHYRFGQGHPRIDEVVGLVGDLGGQPDGWNPDRRPVR